MNLQLRPRPSMASSYGPHVNLVFVTKLVVVQNVYLICLWFFANSLFISPWITTKWFIWKSQHYIYIFLFFFKFANLNYIPLDFFHLICLLFCWSFFLNKLKSPLASCFFVVDVHLSFFLQNSNDRKIV